MVHDVQFLDVARTRALLLDKIPLLCMLPPAWDLLRSETDYETR